MKNHKNNFKKTSTARRTAMQAVYTWTISKEDLSIITNHYLDDRNPKNMDVTYFQLLFNNVVLHQHLIDQAISKYSDRNIKQLDPIELSILRVASYEVIFESKIPFKVIIAEALSLANMFGSNTSYKCINSIIDRLVKEYRTSSAII